MFLISHLNDIIDCDCIKYIRFIFYKIFTPKCVENKNKIINYRKNYLKKFDYIDIYTLQQLKNFITSCGLTCPKNKNKLHHKSILINHRNKIYNEWYSDYKYPLI